MRGLGGVVAVGVWGAVALGPAPGGAEQTGACAIHSTDSATLPSSACVACHESARAGAHAHPLDVSYASAQAGKSTELRAPSEVAQRGIRLPDGELRCATCHDGTSPWAHYLALPPGAEVRLAFESRALGAGEAAVPERTPRPGDAVSAKPLCLGCHAF